MKEIKKIFLIGICGSAMSALAAMFKKSGYMVEGSDLDVYPPASEIIEKHNIVFHKGWNEKNITKNIDLVIIGNVCRKNNPEVLMTHELKLDYMSFPDAIMNFFIKDKESIVVTGTHGKSTITSIISWILEKADMHPSFLIGAIPLNFKKNFQISDKKYFVIEGDEYDSAYFQKNPKFLHYNPKHVIVGSIEFDHLDIYPDLKSYKKAFEDLLDIIPEENTLVVNYDDKNCKDLLKSRNQLFPLWYSIKDRSANWFAGDFDFQKAGNSFNAYFNNNFFDSYKTRLIGDFNISNILAAICLTNALGISKDIIKKGIETFDGLKRRQEYLGSINNAMIFEDFAHHPTAVSVVLKAFSQIKNINHLWAVFEPRSATTRRKIFETEMLEALSIANKVILPNPPDRGDIAQNELFNSKKITEKLQELGVQAFNITNVDEIVNTIKNKVQEGDIVVIMSNGGFGGIFKKLL